MIEKFKLSKGRGKRLLRPFFRGVGATDSKVIKGRYLASFKKRSPTFKCPSLDDALYQRLKQVKGLSASKNTIDHNERALYCVQQKILEAAQPLLFLSNEKLDDDAHREAISVAIQLLGDSFHEVTQQWRRNVLRQTSPSYLYLLDDQDNFNTKEASSLFGKSFVKSMVRSSQQQTMLSNLQPVQRLSGQPYCNGGHQFRHPDGHNNRPSGQSTSHRFESTDTQQGTSFNTQVGEANTISARLSRECGLTEYDTTQQSAGPPRHFTNRGRYVFSAKSDICRPLSSSGSEVAVGGRISALKKSWFKISANPWILELVSTRLRLEFYSTSTQEIVPNNAGGPSQWAICNEEVEGMIKKRAVVRAETRGFVSSIFIIPKKSGGFRPVIKLKRLNTYVVYRHFKMEGVSSIKHVVRHND